jgi:hypothetical protein
MDSFSGIKDIYKIGIFIKLAPRKNPSSGMTVDKITPLVAIGMLQSL